MDVISAQTDSPSGPLSISSGDASGRALNPSERVLAILAHMEAYIDFPEEDIDETGAGLLKRLDAVRAEIDALLDTAEQGRILRRRLGLLFAANPTWGNRASEPVARLREGDCQRDRGCYP